MAINHNRISAKVLLPFIIAVLCSPLYFSQANEKASDGGKILREKYHSETTGADRFCYVYLPDGFNESEKYSVLYVLHGIGGTEHEWISNGSPKKIMNSLFSQGLVEPMILVFPNGRAMVPDSVPSDMFGKAAVAAFENFGNDLFNDLIPFIENKYPVYADGSHRGICGLSMGGGQALNIGLANPDRFSCVGAFSPAPNTDVNKFRLDDKNRIPRISILCGESDDLLFVSEKTHEFLKARNIPHDYKTMPGNHEWKVWKEGLTSFVQIAFK